MSQDVLVSHLTEVVLDPDHQMVVPQVCACCLGPSDSEHKVRVSFVPKDKGIPQVVSFPLCYACEDHERAYRRKQLWVALATAAIVSGCGYAMGLYAQGRLIRALGLALLGCSFVAKFLSRQFPLQHLDDEHGSHIGFVRVMPSDFRGKKVHFQFTNPQYARQFAEANGAEVGTATGVPVDRHYVAAGQGAFQVGFIAMALTVMAVWGVPSLARALKVSLPAPPRAAATKETADDEKRAELKKRIDLLKDEIDGMEDQIEVLDKKLRQTDELLSVHKARMDSAPRHPSLSVVHQGQVAMYNLLVDEFNQTKDQHDSLYRKYEQKIEEHNKLVDEYNALGSGWRWFPFSR